MRLIYIIFVCALMITYCVSGRKQNKLNSMLMKRTLSKKVVADCKQTADGLSNSEDNGAMIKFFEDCIVALYDFEPEDVSKGETPKQFTKVPTFTEDEINSIRPGTDYFTSTAKVAEQFFKNWLSWKKITENPEFVIREKGNENEIVDCQKMLWISAARYVYYIYVLKLKSKEITLCKRKGEQTILPDSVCYPKTIGSLTCLSDVDVGLVGKDSGKTVAAYNQYFADTFGNGRKVCGEENDQACTSDVLMDNNMYAFSLEIATPELFIVAEDKPESEKFAYEDLRIELASADRELYNQWVDVGFAMLQVKRYNLDFYNYFKQRFSKVLDGVGGIFEKLDKLDIKDEDSVKTYSDIVKEIRLNYVKVAIKEVLKSHVFAAESYHSLGSLRTVVVASQMKRPLIKARLSLNDYWASLLENYGYASRYLDTCVKNKKSMRECFKDASKYLWRLFSCMVAAKNVLMKAKDLTRETLESELDFNPSSLKDVTRIRDYMAELLFIFKKRKTSVPTKYYSPILQQELVIEDEIKSTLSCGEPIKCKQAIEQLVKQYSDTIPKVTKKFIPLDYTGDFYFINEDRIGQQKVKAYNFAGYYFRSIVDRHENWEYFNHVTKIEGIILKGYDENQARKRTISEVL